MSDHATESRNERLGAVLASCIESAEQSGALDRERLLAEYPEFADELASYFACREQLERLAAPIRDIVAPAAAPQHDLGDFRLLREIGRGGMGIVYEALQQSLCRRVALKILPFAAVLDDRRLQRFKNEALAAAQLKHPNIVSVLSVGCERGVHYYAMEYVEGQSLAEVVEELQNEQDVGCSMLDVGPNLESDIQHPASNIHHPAPSIDTQPIAALSTLHAPSSVLHAPCSPLPASPREHFRRIAQLGVQAAEALHYAHEMGIVHRDIKPSNLLVDAHGHLWITDFGLATTQADAGLTMTGDLLGTLRYMSPEQAAGDRARTDYRTDIYSLGITLYELLTCQPAFADSDRQILLRRIIEVEPKPPRSLDAAIPRDLETIVLTATAKEPTDRYGAMAALAEDLHRFLDSRPLHAKRHRRLQRVSRWLRRHHLETAAATVVVILIALIQAFALKRETRLRSEAQAQHKRAETNQQLAWDVTFNALAPLTSGWEQLPKSYTLQRQALDKLIAAHRAISDRAEPTSTESLLNFARLLLLRTDNSWQLGQEIKEDCELAISILEPLAASEGANEEINELLNSAYGARGNYLQLQLRFREAATAYADALSVLKASERLGFGGDVNYALNKSGDPSAALKHGLNHLALTRKKEQPGVYHPRSVAVREEAACSLLQLGRAEEAVQLIEEAIDISGQADSNDYLHEYWRARALMTGASIANQSGNSQQGYERAKRAVEIFVKQHGLAPDLVWVTRKLGESYVYLSDSLIVINRSGEAEEALREAARLNVLLGRERDRYDAARVEFRLAQVLAASGRAQEASGAAHSSLLVFEEFAQSLSDEPDCISKLVILLTLSPDVSLRDTTRAADLATRTLPDSCGQYWRLRALAQYRAGQWQDALESASKAMAKLEGGDCIDRFILAMASWQNGNSDDARRWFGEAIDRVEHSAPILYHDMGPLAVRQLKEEAETIIGANTKAAAQNR